MQQFSYYSWSWYFICAYGTWLSLAGGCGRLFFAGSICTYIRFGFPSGALDYTQQIRCNYDYQIRVSSYKKKTYMYIAIVNSIAT